MAGGLLDLDWESEFWVSAIDKSPAAAAHRAAVRGAASLDALLEALLAAEKDCAAAGGDLFGIDGWYGIEFLGLPVFGADPEDRTAVLSWDGGRFLMAGGSGDGPWMLAAREPDPRIRVRRGGAAGAVEVSGMFIDRIRSAESWRALDGYAEAALCMLRRLDGLSDRARTEASEQVKRLCRARGLDLPGWHAPDEALEAVALLERAQALLTAPRRRALSVSGALEAAGPPSPRVLACALQALGVCSDWRVEDLDSWHRSAEESALGCMSEDIGRLHWKTQERGADVWIQPDGDPLWRG